MEASCMFITLLSLLTLLFQTSHSKTVAVDGMIAEMRNPSVHVGDSIIFKHKPDQFDLYIFQNRRAFNLCNFTQATLLTKANTTSLTWHALRPGFFYFSYNNGTLKICEEGEKLALRVFPTLLENMAFSPESPPMAAPSPTSGGVSPTTSAYTPLNSKQPGSLSPAASAGPPATISSVLPETGGGIPFINSNPAVPLPTGEADSATIHPLPTSGHQTQVEGLLVFQIPVCFMVWLVL